MTAGKVLLGVGAAAAVVVVSAALSNNAHHSSVTGTTTPVAGVSQGVAAQDASHDVQVGALRVRKDFGVVTDALVRVTVTNRSSKRSDYIITVALESANGKTQIDTADVFVQNLEPGQTKSDTGDFLSVQRVPKHYKLVLQEVERTASY